NIWLNSNGIPISAKISAEIVAAIIYEAVTGTPVPSKIVNNIVNIVASKIELPDKLRILFPITRTKLVKDIVPTTLPTIIQAAVTIKTDPAPSSNASPITFKPVRVYFLNQLTTTVANMENIAANNGVNPKAVITLRIAAGINKYPQSFR